MRYRRPYRPSRTSRHPGPVMSTSQAVGSIGATKHNTCQEEGASRSNNAILQKSQSVGSSQQTHSRDRDNGLLHAANLTGRRPEHGGHSICAVRKFRSTRPTGPQHQYWSRFSLVSSVPMRYHRRRARRV
uniref:Uncharacterized protein n=1 Tax=Branchiostoma floridae TaxID=7739 RepID=C3YL70_BRAFL|eukprot:XP_002602928.1 hypothetical protein BRAFLDRAFT_107814 [Branchiostoma floridae]